MILNIVSNAECKEFDGNNYNLGIEHLKQKGTHLFIASNKWDKLVVELSDEIPLNILKYVVSVSSDIEVIYPDNITKHTSDLLCELYPDKCGLIRKYFMMGKDIREAVL